MSALRALLPAILLSVNAADPGKPAGGPSAEIPAGTLLSVELVDPVHSGKSKAGDSFRARLLEGIWARGAMVVPPGAALRGELTKVVPSGRVKGRSELELTLRSI